jgi:hypothetical protein
VYNTVFGEITSNLFMGNIIQSVCGLNVQFPTEVGSHETRDNSFYGELEQVFD